MIGLWGAHKVRVVTIPCTALMTQSFNGLNAKSVLNNDPDENSTRKIENHCPEHCCLDADCGLVKVMPQSQCFSVQAMAYKSLCLSTA